MVNIKCFSCLWEAPNDCNCWFSNLLTMDFFFLVHVFREFSWILHPYHNNLFMKLTDDLPCGIFAVHYVLLKSHFSCQINFRKKKSKLLLIYALIGLVIEKNMLPQARFCNFWTKIAIMGDNSYVLFYYI